MPQWPVPADHAILVGGLPLFHEYEAAADIYPGYVVSFTKAYDPVTITPCDSDSTDHFDPVGVAVLDMADQDGHGSWRRSDCTGASDSSKDYPYETGDQVKVLSGNIFVMLVLDENETIHPGDKLMCSAANPGLVIEYFCGLTTSDPCALVAEAMEYAVTHGGDCEYILVKLLI